MPLQPGQMLHERYKILHRLGQGGMGTVFQAHDDLYDRQVAIKELMLSVLPGGPDETRSHAYAGSLTFTQAVEQFRREARLLARLEHPSLPRVTDYFGLADDYYLVMDLVEGRDLESILQQNQYQPLPEAPVLDWADQVLDALSYCHAQGVIHRDIKPANVILTPAGRAFLVDFGIARQVGPEGQALPGMRAATPGYSPPEQYGPSGGTEPRSDIYSLGATLYTLLTGKDPVGALERTHGAPMPSPLALNPALTPRLADAIEMALDLDMARRFQSAQAMRRALQAPRLKYTWKRVDYD